MPERSLINEHCEHCSKSPDFFPAETANGKFQCAKMRMFLIVVAVVLKMSECRSRRPLCPDLA